MNLNKWIEERWKARGAEYSSGKPPDLSCDPYAGLYTWGAFRYIIERESDWRVGFAQSPSGWDLYHCRQRNCLKDVKKFCPTDEKRDVKTARQGGDHRKRQVCNAGDALAAALNQLEADFQSDKKENKAFCEKDPIGCIDFFILREAILLIEQSGLGLGRYCGRTATRK